MFSFLKHGKEARKPEPKAQVKTAAATEPVAFEPKVLSPKAVDELREILGKDEDVKEFFLFLKDRDLRMQAVKKLNQAIGN